MRRGSVGEKKKIVHPRKICASGRPFLLWGESRVVRFLGSLGEKGEHSNEEKLGADAGRSSGQASGGRSVWQGQVEENSSSFKRRGGSGAFTSS